MNIDIAVYDDFAAGHVHADIRTCIALDEDLATGHPSPVAAVCCAEIVAGIPLDNQIAAFHSGCRECCNISLREDLATGHPRSDIQVSVAFYDKLPGGHLETEVFHLLHIAFDNDLRVGRSCTGITLDLEIFSEGRSGITFVDVEFGDLCCGLARKCI